MSLSDALLALGPVAYYTSVSGIDQSPNGNNLTRFCGGNASLSPIDVVDDDLGNGMKFLGSTNGGDNLWNPDPKYPDLNISDPGMSLFFVMNPDVVGDIEHDTARKSTQYGIYLGTDNKAHAVIQQGGFQRIADGATTIPTGVKTVATQVYDGADLNLYINGELDGQLPVSGFISTTDIASFTIGTNAASANGFRGIMYHVALFDKTLTPEQVTDLYNEAIAAAPPPGGSAVGYYSGGDDNSTGSASLGGEEGTLLAQGTNSLFDTPLSADRVAGFNDYRCVYMHNVSETDTITDVRIYLDSTTVSGQVGESIGKDPSGTAQVIANAKAVPSGVVFTTPLDYATGIHLGDLAPGAKVPVWIKRIVSANTSEGTYTFKLGVSWAEATNPLATTVSYSIVAPVRLYVNADHPDANDSYSRAEARDNPDKPFKKPSAALYAMAKADIMQIEPAANADVTNIDPSMYPALDARVDPKPVAANSFGSDGSQIVGHVVGSVRPKIAYFALAGFDTWDLSNIQFGYDRGSGHDHDTAGFFNFNYDLHFTNCVWTGGTFWVRGFGGLLWFDGCFIFHPYTGNNFFSGVGIWLLEIDAGPIYPTRPGTLRVTSSLLEDCKGEDAIQCSSFETGSKIEIGVNGDTGEVLGNVFNDLPQTGGAHTDATQCFGCHGDITIVGNHYINCASPIILSDDEFEGRVILGKNIFGEGSVWAIQIQGCHNAWILHNTCKTIWQIAVYTRQLGVSQNVRIINNIVPELLIQASDIDPASIITNNLTFQQPGLVTSWGTQLPGQPEFGISTRLTDAGVTEPYELANDADGNAGIGQGRALTGLGLTTKELGYFANDFYGRPYATPRDVGALQSDPAHEVLPVARPPFIKSRTPSPGATSVNYDSSVVTSFLPKRGEALDPDTVASNTANVRDSSNKLLPAVVSLGAQREDGSQDVIIDPKLQTTPTVIEGRLSPLVQYTVNMSGIKDTEGSQIDDLTWSFTAKPRSTPEILALDDPDLPPPENTYTFGGAAQPGNKIGALDTTDADGIHRVVKVGEEIKLTLDVYNRIKNWVKLTPVG